MRRYVRYFAITKIHFLAGREVVSLGSGTGGSAVVGVRTRRRRGSTEAEESLLVILVVDAS